MIDAMVDTADGRCPWCKALPVAAGGPGHFPGCPVVAEQRRAAVTAPAPPEHWREAVLSLVRSLKAQAKAAPPGIDGAYLDASDQVATLGLALAGVELAAAASELRLREAATAVLDKLHRHHLDMGGPAKNRYRVKPGAGVEIEALRAALAKLGLEAP